MKALKKIAVIMIAAVMICTMSVPVFADAVLNGGIAGDLNDAATPLDNTVLILKELIVYNTTGKNIYLPTVGYTYTITGETVANDTTVTDSGDHTWMVYAGKTDALDDTSKTVAFSSTTTAGYKASGESLTIQQPTAASDQGTAYYGGFTISVDPDKLGHAGIFRYKISEAEDATNTLAKAGVVHQNNSYNRDRFFDVYVRQDVNDDDKDNSTEDYLIYGYVLWSPVEGQSQDTSIEKTPNVTKTIGWVGDLGGDEYNTWNLVVTKTITGGLADTTHQFPFQVVFTSPNATAATIHYTVSDGIPDSQTTATISSAATTEIGTLGNDSALKLTNNGIVTFCGIPAGVTATVQENNDTYDTYTAKAEIIAKTDRTYTDNQVRPGDNATIITDLDNATTTDQVATTDTETKWDNNMAVVSPTGLVMRFAPYALILVAGIVLLIIALKRKSRKNDDD